MTKTNFAACLDVVLRHEGGYVDDRRDSGGATNRGITLRTLAAWRGVTPWTSLPKSEVRGLGIAETKAIYRARYWNPIAGDELPQGLDLVVFDFAVNSGPPRAVRFLQAALGVKQDGVVGPVTLGAVAAAASKNRVGALIRSISARRLGFLRGLNTFSVFGKGWTRRVADTQTRALAMRPATETTSSQTKGNPEMDILSGYKTYIVGVLMILTAAAQMAGIDLPGFDGQSAMQLLMEGLAIVFLRKGIAANAAA